MATLVLQAVGGALGGMFGSFGAAVGTAVGALAGYWVDQTLFGPDLDREGGRLDQMGPMSAREGAAIPRQYGWGRLSTTVIWATRFEEEVRTERVGGKGGPKLTTYSYFGNFAAAICEGPIATIRRVWADGRELDLSEVMIRACLGGQSQPVDALIDAKQGPGNAPAYRGVAYLVFERMPLEAFGNRIPQIEVEVSRPVGGLERAIGAMSVIPAATEHGYDRRSVTRLAGPGETVEDNRHIRFSGNNWTASIDELQAVCPNLRHVSLIIAWYGNDLRAQQCTLRPGVTVRAVKGESRPWSVAGLGRQASDVHQVSIFDGRPAYGGSPTDSSLIEAIGDLTARGIKVMIHPFVMMDIAAGNGLADPYGDGEQAPHPWRGQTTCFPAPGQPGTADKTAQARAQVEEFLGQTLPGDLSASGRTVTGGPAADWRYRRFVLHLAKLAALAGGVDCFLIGSELRALTTLRDEAGRFPFVEGLAALATDVRSIVGPDCRIGYGADWSEYFGHQPPDGSGDAIFHLDPLWADANIDFVGIDNYMPLSDWQDADRSAAEGNPDGMAGPDDRLAMAAMVAGGEGFDWFYASASDRQNRDRSPITDGAYGKPWVYRYKDLVNWWSTPHFDRIGGAEAAMPTAWVPRSKPFVFTELGCGAVHAGANQPNIFGDPKSSVSGLPYHSHGARDDSTQRAFLTAHHDHWARVGSPQNPVAPVTGQPMVDPAQLYLWSWDARPYPAFPLNAEVWGDGDNWLTGHWLNGRLGAAPLAELIDAIFADHGLPAPDTEGVRGVVEGFTVARPAAIRATLAPLVDAFGLIVNDTGGAQGPVIGFRSPGGPALVIDPQQLCQPERGDPRRQTMAQADELPAEMVVGYRSAIEEYRPAAARSLRRDVASARVGEVNLPCVLDQSLATELAEQMLDRTWQARSRVQFELPLSHASLEPGDLIAFADQPHRKWRAGRIELTGRLQVEATSTGSPVTQAIVPQLPQKASDPASTGRWGGQPVVELLDLPLLDETRPQDNVRIAAFVVPQMPQQVLASPTDAGFELRQTLPANAIMGALTEPLSPGPVGRYDRVNAIAVRLYGGALQSVDEPLLFGGRNTLAVLRSSGQAELVQFGSAEETGPGQWRLTNLLRGQAGTDDQTLAAAPAGSRIVLIDVRVPPAGLHAAEAGLEMQWRVGPSGRTFASRYFAGLSAAAGRRALLPLAPVHLRAYRSVDDSIALSWVRRTRIGGDGWEGVTVPLGEEQERYLVTVYGADGAAALSIQTGTPRTVLAPGQVAGLFGAPPTVIDIGIVQLSARAGSGVQARRTIPVKSV